MLKIPLQLRYEEFCISNGAHILFGIPIILGTALGGIHYGTDHLLNHGRFVELKEQFAKASVAACGNGEPTSARNNEIYSDVHHDLSEYLSSFGWMPNGSAANLIEQAIDNNVVIYHATLAERTVTFDKNVKGVLYNYGERGSVFVYGDLDRAQFRELFNQIGQQPDKSGNFVVRFDDIHNQYQFIHVPEGQNTTVLDNGIETIKINSNPCLSNGGLRGLAAQVVKDKAHNLVDKVKKRFELQP